MSGIVGILRRNGAPVDRPLLESSVDFLGFRGPDAGATWIQGPVGLGHTLLRTSFESLGERQPAGLNSDFWITADVRLDCRSELQGELTGAGYEIPEGAPDSELILRAYAAWGEACVRHLRGDFAFAIWDARRKTLFCARDHFGVKPFYYAALENSFFFSNTLDCVRLHPDVSDQLNETAVADFLLFGMNYDVATTTFRDIQRLPAAHSLSVSAGSLRIERYWSAPTDGRIRYRNTGDYVEHFQVLLQAAVADRLRVTRAGILLSGGMDSSSIASVARDLSVKASPPTELRAYTIVYDSLIPDHEAEHARKVADFLKIPQRCFAMDDIPLFDRWDDPRTATPEPVDDPFFAGLFDHFQMMSQECRVVLGGEGADNLMHFQMWPYTRSLLKNREWKRLFTDVPRYLRVRQFPWQGISQRARRLVAKDTYAADVPRWIAPDFARRVDLASRWKERRRALASQGHPVFPIGHASLSLPQWSRRFEFEDPGLTRHPVEVRHPFMDLRVVSYLLSVPPFPWAFRKILLREAMSGHLPESIRSRQKEALAGDPVLEMLRRPESAWVDHFRWNPQIEAYVNPAALPAVRGAKVAARMEAIRPLCLNFWLQSSQQIRYKLKVEAHSVQAHK